MNGVPRHHTSEANSAANSGGRAGGGSGVDLRRSQQLSISSNEPTTTTTRVATTSTPTISRDRAMDNLILAGTGGGVESNTRTSLYHTPFALSADNVVGTQPTSTTPTTGCTSRGTTAAAGGNNGGAGQQQQHFQQQQPPPPTYQQWFYNTTTNPTHLSHQYSSPCYGATSSARVQSIFAAGIPIGYATPWISAAELQHGATRSNGQQPRLRIQQQQPFVVPFFGNTPTPGEHNQLANQHASPAALSSGEQHQRGSTTMLLPNIPELTWKSDHVGRHMLTSSSFRVEPGDCDTTHQSTNDVDSSQRADPTESRSSTTKLPDQQQQQQQQQQQRATSDIFNGSGWTARHSGTSSSGKTTQRIKSNDKICGKLSQKRFVYIFGKKKIFI